MYILSLSHLIPYVFRHLLYITTTKQHGLSKQNSRSQKQSEINTKSFNQQYKNIHFIIYRKTPKKNVPNPQKNTEKYANNTNFR